MSSITNPIVSDHYGRINRVLGVASVHSLIVIEIDTQKVKTIELTPTNPILTVPTIDIGNGIELVVLKKRSFYIKDHFLHREDGPAVIWEGGASYDGQKAGKEFWLHGKKFHSAEEYFEALTSEQKEKAVWNLDEIK